MISQGVCAMPEAIKEADDGLEATAAWLVDGARSAVSAESALDELCRRLVAGGLPLWRVAVFIRTLHPSLMGRGLYWRANEPIEVFDAPFEIATQDAFRVSLFARVATTGEAIRRRLCDPACPRDFPLLREFDAEGVTDYLAAPLRFTDGQCHVATFSTRLEVGFTAQNVADLERMLPALARVAEVRTLRRTAITLLDAYVGHDAGEKILAGKIQRGDAETIRAAIWLADMRGFTRLADQAPPEQVIERLNAFFDCLARAIEQHGGYVLKFMGDGLLAIFPARGESGDQDARVHALSAAEQACANVRAFNAGCAQPALRFGLALHFGEALYGNIGGGSRLDFTCIGPAINMAARIERIAARLGRTVVASRAFAEPLAGAFEPLGAFELPGFQERQDLFGLPGDAG
jgi:adenylate cyclase